MPQIQIKDALGNVQTAAKVTNTGRTSHTDSMPVTLSNEDFAQLQSIDTKTPALVSGAVPVNPVVSKGAGVVDANTQRVTLASDGPTVSTLTQIDTKTPTLVNGAVPTTDTKGGTRIYDFDGNIRLNATSTSSAATPIPTLYADREIMVHAKKRCMIRYGAAAVAAADATATTGHLTLEDGEKFHFRIPVGVTHFRVVRDSEDGSLTHTAVVS